MKSVLLTGWNPMRFIRLAIGIWALSTAYPTKDVFIGIMGGILILMVIFNIGCCGINGCSTSPKQNKATPQKTGEIDYEEIS